MSINNISNKYLVTKIYEEYLQLNNKIIIIKLSIDLNRHFFKKEKWPISKEKSLISLIITEV